MLLDSKNRKSWKLTGALMQSFQMATSSPLQCHRFPLHKLSPNTSCPLFSLVSKVATGKGVAADCLPPVSLPPGLREESMPAHVAMIMDGSRRWARMRGLTVMSGYEAGAQALRRAIDLCCKWRIKVLSVFAFSSENWFRPKVEIDYLMDKLEKGLRHEVQYCMRENIRLSIIGDCTELPKSLQVLKSEAEETTKNNSHLHLIVAVNYSGQNDILQACRNMALKVKDGVIQPQDVDKFLLEKELGTNCTEFPSPDLLIRTSGELRISNFLLWQLAYTELYFANSLWPDFGEGEFIEALSSFQKRQRRYGGRS